MKGVKKQGFSKDFGALFVNTKVYIKLTKSGDETADEVRWFIPKKQNGFFKKENLHYYVMGF